MSYQLYSNRMLNYTPSACPAIHRANPKETLIFKRSCPNRHKIKSSDIISLALRFQRSLKCEFTQKISEPRCQLLYVLSISYNQFLTQKWAYNRSGKSTLYKMDFVKSKWSGLVKAYKHYVHPNDNPTEEDKKAFRLLDNAEIDMFIEFFESNPVNIHVRDFSTVNFLIKAQDVANDTNPVKKLLTQDERTARAIKATTYLIEKGIDINYRDKSGGTALQAAVHWSNFEVAEVLLKHGADPNLGSSERFLNIPLISATFKQNEKMIVMLISYGANVEEALALVQKNKGFPLTQQQKDLLISASNLESLIRRRRYQQALERKTVLALISEAQFEELCFYV